MIFEAHRQRPLDYALRNPAAVAVVERYCLTRAARVWVVIDEMAERLVRLGVPADRIDLVSNTPPRKRAEADSPVRTRKPGEPLTLVYLGLLEISRGLGESLDAVALLRADGCAVRCTIVGNGRDAEIFRRQAHALHFGDESVRFLGYVDRETALATAVREADIGVLPNHMNEAWNTTIPNKLFDYMAEALPVLSSSVAPFARIAREDAGGRGVRGRQCAFAGRCSSAAGRRGPSRRMRSVRSRGRTRPVSLGARHGRAPARDSTWPLDQSPRSVMRYVATVRRLDRRLR